MWLLVLTWALWRRFVEAAFAESELLAAIV